MNEKTLLKIAKKSAIQIGCPKRTPTKNFLLGVWSEIYVRLLWIGVKLKMVNFYTFQAYCFNREYYLDTDWKGRRAL